MTEETTDVISVSCPPVWGTLERTADHGPVHHASAEPKNTRQRNLPQHARDALDRAKAVTAPLVER